MASYAGNDMGPAVQMQTSGNEPQLQLMAYPALNGLGVNNLGSRGGKTVAFGVLYAELPTDLSDLEQTFRSLQVGGQTDTLVDTLAKIWDGVILLNYSPIDSVSFAPGYGYARAYTMEFLHTS